MSQLIDVVKRGGKRPNERFQPGKLHGSIKAACLSVRSPDGEAETAAKNVCDAVLIWCNERPEITTLDLRRVASYHLARIHPDAAYMYKNHRLVL